VKLLFAAAILALLPSQIPPGPCTWKMIEGSFRCVVDVPAEPVKQVVRVYGAVLPLADGTGVPLYALPTGATNVAVWVCGLRTSQFVIEGGVIRLTAWGAEASVLVDYDQP
jgi:hypothetical protein